jgi:N-6 DNA Methylase
MPALQVLDVAVRVLGDRLGPGRVLAVACIFGNTLSADGLPGKRFDYMLSNPPFGVEWKKIEKEVRKEAEDQGFNGRFGPGLPRVSDGSLLFLLHLVSKMQLVKHGGSRLGIVLNGSPLFTGGAGSGESPLRQDRCRLFETRLWGRTGLRDDRVQRRLSSTDGRENDGPETDVGERAGVGGWHQPTDTVAVVARRGYCRGRVQEEGESEAVAA